MALDHLDINCLREHTNENHAPCFAGQGRVASGVSFSAGHICGQRSEQVGLDHPEGWGYGVAGGVPGAHGGLDESGPELGTQDACFANFFKEGQSVGHKAKVETMPVCGFEP